jgi:hypothetical protein
MVQIQMPVVAGGGDAGRISGVEDRGLPREETSGEPRLLVGRR